MLTPSLETVAASATGGFGIGVGFFFVRWVAIFVSGRWDKKEAQLDAGTQRLIDRLETQVQSLLGHVARIDEELAECRRLHSESEALRLQAEALLQGSGDARQLAALIVASEKNKDK